MNPIVRGIIDQLKPNSKYVQSTGEYSNLDINLLIKYIEENEQSKEVKIQFKNVYGKQNIYIITKNIEHISVLTGKATVNYLDLMALKNLGFTISGYGADEDAWLKQKGVVE